MRIFLPLVTWIVLLSSTVHSQIKTIRSDQAHLKNSRFGGEVFFLNLEDGYFGCQVNESTDYLQLFELSKLCDGRRDCFLGADELREELKCTNDCDKDGTKCTNGVCLNGVCHCNDGFGGCNCSERDENECKYRPCDVFAHCINTLGSFTCTCFPGYHGNGLHCEDIDECQDPTIRARCVENAECCNLPAHYLCKCRDGYEGDGEVLCTDLDECQSPTACGTGAQCINTPGNYTCACPDGYHGDPYYSCTDIDECTHPNACGPGAICTNLEGGYRCDCPEGYDGDARSANGCADFDECARSPCGRNAQCLNTDGSFKCICPDGYAGDPSQGCEAACILDTECGATEVCQGGQCVNPCLQAQACGMNAECHIQTHYKQCSCPAGFTGNPDVECVRIPVACNSDVECREGYNCHDSMCQPACHSDQDCALNEKCLRGSCMLTCRVDNDCFLGHVCLHNKCVYGCRTDDDCSASESCRHDKCTNPCLDNPCGPNAACSVSNHRAICSCLDGMVPNPTPQVGCVRSPPLDCNENRDCANGLACFEFACRPLCADDAGCLSNERCQGGVCKPLCRRDDDCRGSEVCLGLSCVAGCRSDQGCPHDLSCVNQQCINPCAEPAACGTNAECLVIDHRKQCTCPQGLIGNAEVSCKAPRTACTRNEDCDGNQLCYGGSCQGKCRNDQNCLADERCMRGTCRTVCNTDSACAQGQICENRVCQIGCRNDLTCPSSEACVNKKCKNPCETPGQCGQCANCLVVNHGVQCSCPNGFLGDGLSGCQQPPQRCNPNCQCDETNTYCADACARTEDCACGQVCTRGKCRQKCGVGRNCPLGQLCERGTCLAGCKANSDCPTDQSCLNGKCADPCANKSACGRNALCTVSDHRMLCYCPDGYEGEPSKECIQFECAQDNDCEPNKRCDAGKCRNPCLEYGACGVNAQCRVVDRKPQCSCPPDYFGTPETECRPLDGGCANHPCGANSKCIEVPGGYECACMDGCMGDAHKGCVCEGHLVNACAEQPCGQNAACRVLDHNEAQCYCPEEFPFGDAYVECYLTPPQEDCRTQGCITGECVRQGVDYVCRHDTEQCTSDVECPSEKSCLQGHCVDPCSVRGVCGANALCKSVLHRPRCSCPSCYIGRPEVECKPDPKCTDDTALQPRDPQQQIPCTQDNDCPDTLQCSHYGQCTDPCQNPLFICGGSKKCETRRHQPVCVCKSGFIVNEYGELTCAPEKRECYRDDDCASNMACSEGKCRSPCVVPVGRQPICAENKSCEVQDHKPVCICMKDCQPSISICLRDAGCPSGLACRSYQCVNPCDFATCAPNSPCIVEDHKPICKFCPPGFIADAKNGCQKEIGCASSDECPTQRACINGVCLDPCSSANPCGREQECQVIEHQPVCSKVCECQRKADCRPGFECDGCHCRQTTGRTPGCEHCPTGTNCDPTTGACIKAECTHNSDCDITEACINRRCQHPCDAHNPCAQNAVCMNSNHAADCSCLDGYQGNGFIGCQPALDHTPVCQYNEDCPPTKLCDRLNRRCINPCFEDSCGDNAECIPVNHGIECRCLAGFVGNAYIECSQLQGCRADRECDASQACINGKCASPCRCGANALCDVVNHRGICKCPPGYAGRPEVACNPPTNPCEPNPCGVNALCELDNGNPICFCPKGLTGNPFKNCIPEGDECRPNPCGPNSGCRMVSGAPTCFCLPEYEGQPPLVPCEIPKSPCDPSPCGPNTQCAILSNGFSKCTCLPGYVESPNTIRGCIEPVNPCDPSPCGPGAVCDSSRTPVCFCPDGKIGNPFKACEKPPVSIELCTPGPCGRNADCYVTGNREECYCRSGYIGDPYQGCREPPRSACEPNPCGPNAECVVAGDGQSACICPDGLSGDPTSTKGCHGYECQVDADCPHDKACMGFKCYDPCPGACGQGANCRVQEHHPVCSCNAGLTGNPGIRCYALDIPKTPSRNPCLPSPCGVNSECKILNHRAVCSCLPGYLGDPQSGCRPECDINSDCGTAQACINHKCIDPCAGTVCGINAICRVQQHTPICGCLDGFTGDAFRQCIPVGVLKNVTRDPCVPSPCGPHDVCSIYGDGVALCDPCFGPNAQQNPRCRPECISNSDCPFDRACLGQRCLDPCPGSCGHNAVCNVYEHNPICSCPPSLYGNPYEHCSPPSPFVPTPSPSCEKLHCGANAECKKRGGALTCVCRTGYFGDPFIGCRPECVLNSDCPADKSCVNSKCVDSCVGVCGINAMCRIVNHAPVCLCVEGYTGDAAVQCNPYYLPPERPADRPRNPCEPSPCGPNSRCLTSPDGYAACSCLPNFKGSPPVCQPECVVSSECPLNKACINQRCADPCPGTCGVEARCEVLNHNPICSCEPGFEGDPFVSCSRIPEERTDIEHTPGNPCVPSPCGPNSVCQIKQGRPVCSCVANYIGSPPYCRPECTLNTECPADKACIQEKCQNPCANTCGHNALCTVIAHAAHCSCERGYEGDAFVGCSKIDEKPKDRIDPCYPSPCGENALCSERNGEARCSCIEPYIGDPYTTGCRPECVYNAECPSSLACIKQHCRDPCVGTCGSNAECAVVNHIPTCSCTRGYEGDPFTGCKREDYPMGPISPCEPTPCGANSICRVVDGRPTCSCQVGYFGAPPSCRPECVVSSECSQNLACINQKCVDPCIGTCGFNAKCQVVNHNPICSCPRDYMGDPFEQCIPKPREPPPKVNPCLPSPCGPNAECREVDNRAACSCSPGMFGAPPNCRPECVIHQDCPSNRACIRQRCEDPCAGACGFNALCTAQNHKPVCSCLEGYEGDPYAGCNTPQMTPTEAPRNPCNPSPCGANAVCRERNGAGSCSCLPEYFGDPYSGCRPECVQNSDCDRSRACINNKCQDPCPGVCGINAECRVLNHAPNCLCFDGYTGDPHRSCAVIEITTMTPINPCQPSPCGPYSECRESNGHAVCSCVDNYVGAPPSCKPECVVSSECPQNRACLNQKCADPCRGACGNNARCQVVNHNPICTCAPGLTGDPFTSCIEEPEVVRDPQNPCVPSPCGPNSLCREIGGQAACSCQTNYVGRPPNCRPECTNNDECPNNLSCQNERCVDPCPGSCGNNAFCKVVQHNAICSCADGYEGDPILGCDLIQPVLPKQPPTSPCEPSPCGPHAECRERNGAGACYCHEGFEGNPYDIDRGCRRECEVNDDCSTAQACVRFKCVDPCDNICGEFAICSVENHVPTCNCPPGYSGDPFFQCKQIPVTPPPPINPCVPSPCGPNSICRSINDQAVCSCKSGFINQPPNCRPECVVSSECAPERACVNNKCVDPCLHTCGIRAICTTKNHSPICTCPRGMTGDPFVQCSKIPIIHDIEPTERPPSCVPSPCGPNSKCQIVGGSPACSCLQDFIGAPPNCRPECVLNSECGPTEACINQKCRDPCPGSCGFEAKCHVLNHVPICNCIDGYTGDPFIRCSPIPPVTETPKTPNDPCDPNPCGPNADCFNGECRCQDNYQGNPYDGCRPECTLSADCARDKACMRNKCVDPCPGTCGINAVCEVLNHIPICSCVADYEGDPFSSCKPKVIIERPEQVCSPSPCGANSQCRDINGHAVCSCLDGYIGSPPQCRPECVVSSECTALQACVNKKCTDPCAGSCGIDARCEVINHSPICGCPPGKTGDPFKRCLDLPPPEPPRERDPGTPRDPCVPSPCGPNSICKASGSGPSCQCLPEFFGSPPNCRPECIINPDCPSSQACINNKCRDPCPGSCGTNAECRVISHTVSCSCPTGFAGNAFVQCVPAIEEPVKPCEPSPCGANAECIERNGAASCKCIDDYQGNPYDGCRPECVLSSDCPTDKACIRNKCKDPCPGICGSNALCYAVNHVPNCVCSDGYTGDPFSNCQRQVTPQQPPPQGNPCQPSPCGPNSKCRVSNSLAVCSCLDTFIGAPPNCKPECTVNTECPQNKACHNFRCANPCAGTCGVDAKCEVINHNPICSCPLDMTGDPFSRCYPAPIPAPKDEPKTPKNPCFPSPCGLYAECRAIGDQPSCSCLSNYIGVPPNCRPECVVNTDCPSDKSCIAEKCRNPCEGTCGIDSECRIQNHLAICTCRTGYTGDPFSQCVEIIEVKTPPTVSADPCDLQPCGANAECDNGICTCIRDYQGDPYVGCRPECTLSTDCSPNRACLNKKCVDPCPGTCGQSAQCDVSNHIPICSCPKGYTGDPFIHCRPEIIRDQTPKDPCQPNPCGPNSICQTTAQGAVCACQPGMLGSPPACKPECIVSSECSLQTACIQKKCVDPCPGACGQFARCQVINHNPICTCNSGYTGDPFTRCYEEERDVAVRPPTNPCIPSPCGPNSECKVVGDSPACSCAVSFLGKPPNCRPECTINPECPPTKACIRQKCEDPCVGSCGFNARCNVANHMPICTCEVGYTGDPFTGCQPVQVLPPPPKQEPRDPCRPSPCGPNSECRGRGDSYTCSCINDYIGNPYEGCRPECIGNSECSSNRACIRNKCADPCPGTCGVEALCTIHNHIPICSCPSGYSGNAFVQCSPVVIVHVPQERRDPCYPTPCGTNTVCKVQRDQAVCECLPGFFGNPQGQGCRPECTLSSDCAKDKACVNTKCVDPCPGVCGYGAQCQTANHNPICSCPSPMVGNPFVECHAPPQPIDPCNPSPCRSNGICHVINGAATCTYPECVTNEDCSRNRACINQKCRDPCINACGVNAICNAINHKAVCTCPTGYYGSPFNQCLPQMEEIPAPRPECTTDAECSNDKACVNQACHNPCELSNICGTNARCHVQLHRPLCVCNEGYTGNAFSYCHVIGCRSDEECPATEACINKQCTDPCPYTQCGTNAICRADYNHKARCHCPDGYRGNPLVRCERPECTRDDECAFNLACKNERCEDPCNCGVGAQCRVDNHRAQCRCPPGYSGNPLVSCVLEEPKVAPQCTMDADCTSKLACFNGECKNPCTVTQPCGANAICSVVDTLPLRTMICQCEPGYVGDADVGCRKEPARDHGCQSNSECQDTEACRNGVCVNPCIDGSPCARTAECLAQRHRAVCSCPQGTQGDPFTNCYQPPEITAGCKHDSECPSTTACINQRCQDPCAEANPCAGNAECRVRNSRPICSCPAGWGGDPQVQCYKPECKINADCPYDKACINENCVNPCSYGEVRCGTGAQCAPQNHQAVCICPPGTQGNPFVSCITGRCQYNEDCADHEACDRLNRVCRPVCDEDTCALNAICTGSRHQPQCECRPGYRGNPFVQCDLPREPPTKVEPECKQDADCPSQLACINQRCANPCATPHVCTPQQTCHVLDTLPLRTMICKCPSDTITDNSGNCVPIKHEMVSGCQSNDECANTEVCQRGACIDACRVERCGVNAQCRSRDHYAECTCARGYEGNPRVECQLIVHEQPKTPGAECTKNDDCPYDKTCKNERCVNPCAEDSCGRGAYCHVQNREPVCRCPTGFTGDARVACIPPQDVSTVGCKSNSDCALTESCVNERCVNPCNCGPNAECIVRNHHPVCYCQPGYSGNAQFGCVQIGCQSDDECSTDQQCVNRECVNPCLISDPCALNAECFGRNHRATCRCPTGLEGDPFQRCVRVECHSDYDCATNQACVRNQCVNPCQDSPCAQNAICQALQHRAVCRCPETMPLGNPYAYCERRPVEPVCRDDGDCPSRLACIDNKCQNPCTILSPCASSAKCSVLDSVPVRTMVCECPESYVPDARGECKPIVLQSPPGCSSDADCPDQEACINRQCRNPCNCGTNAICQVQNHRATCSCQDGYEGNPYAFCRTIGCRIDSECDSGKACINGNCINPCLVNDPCGINAECYVQSNTAMCRCKSGYRGNAYERCRVIGCLTNNDCPSDKMCNNEQCVNPCIYHNTCSPRAECRAQNHLAVCRCPAGFLGNPYVDCRPEPQPMCKVDTDCPARLACINDECVDPCLTLEPCNRPAQCEVTPTSPVRTMICVCPDGYISSGSGTCKPTKTIVEVGGCIADSDCATDKSCINGICRDPCNCGLNAECRIKDHKPVCTCRQGYEGNPEFECSKIECAINSDCPSTHACRNQLCVPVCQGEQCGTNAECLAVDHRAVCECVPGFRGNARIACTPLGCRTDGECPSDKACVNGKCENPCDTKAICAYDEICKVYNHQPECACPPGTIARRNGCEPLRDIPICRYDGDCPSQTACIRGECVNPCNATHPCGVNADCRVLDTVPVRTMICECLEGYTGNAAVQCDKRSLCVIEKGFVRDVDGQCVCPPGTALDIYEYCAPCLPEQGFKIDENGRCVCALERGMVIDERGRCICPTDHGYRLTPAGECIAEDQPGCETNEDCADNRFCNTRTKTCEDPCLQKVCGVNAFCNAINHRAQCQCITGYTGNPELICNHTNFRTDFPRPDMLVSCLADGVQVEIHITEPGFNGVLYVKGHSKDEECRRVVNLAGESVPRTEIFRVHFGSCGMQAVKDIASFVLVIQKHPKLVTYKAQAYNIKCVYQTGEKNVTLGFNVSMLTTAGTIANTGPPPICQMRIITHEGEEINSAEIGDNLKLQVDVEPATIYGGFARSCIAKTMEDNIENEYIVTDENGCATDASIFGEWEYNPDTNSLMANFNAFKFPSSDNIRFQCNIRVCFGKCQPVNCRGYNAFGRRRRRAIADNSTDTTAVATNTGMEGQLREEITISSNAILTFEKRSGPGINDANIKPAAQRVEDICVSMVGLIIALVITALLALVAVAVAVSCWLMAYRRRPKTLAPLPHPPEFPNPLFANPEAVPEPTPDYLS